MKIIARQFPLVFFAGLASLAVSIGYGSISGEVLGTHPVLSALRFLAGGLMASAMALWIMLLREEAEQPGISPLIGLLLLAGVILLVVRFLFPSSGWTSIFDWGGLGLTVLGLIVGIISMVVAPAYPKPMTARWPEGGESIDPHHTTQSH